MLSLCEDAECPTDLVCPDESQLDRSHKHHLPAGPGALFKLKLQLGVEGDYSVGGAFADEVWSPDRVYRDGGSSSSFLSTAWSSLDKVRQCYVQG